jgi:hypothetical protein
MELKEQYRRGGYNRLAQISNKVSSGSKRILLPLPQKEVIYAFYGGSFLISFYAYVLLSYVFFFFYHKALLLIYFIV